MRSTRHAPCGIELRLKWPNDVLIGRAKVAGILLESAASDNGAGAAVIVGTGVNIVSRPSDTPYPATSLAEQGFAAITPRALLVDYLRALDHWLGRWREAGFAEVRAAWCARGFGLGEQIGLRLAREELFGRFVDVTPSGALLLDLDGGGRREIAAGDVFYPSLRAMEALPARHRRRQHEYRLRALSRPRAAGAMARSPRCATARRTSTRPR